MREFDQIRSFYMELTERQRCDMAEAISDDIMFFDTDFQYNIMSFLDEIIPELSSRIKEINGFTL